MDDRESIMDQEDCCEEARVHPEAIARAQAQLAGNVAWDQLAAFFKIFGDEGRIRLLRALSAGELCVCDLAEVLGMSQSATSHQLRLLKSMRLVRARREGKQIFYRLDDDHIGTILACGLVHISEE